MIKIASNKYDDNDTINLDELQKETDLLSKCLSKPSKKQKRSI